MAVNGQRKKDAFCTINDEKKREPETVNFYATLNGFITTVCMHIVLQK